MPGVPPPNNWYAYNFDDSKWLKPLKVLSNSGSDRTQAWQPRPHPEINVNGTYVVSYNYVILNRALCKVL